MIQILKQIFFLSILQTVFSKRSADTLRSYFGESNASSQNHAGSAYRIRKQGLAFIQSRAVKYLNPKSEQIYGFESLEGTTSSTQRHLFSFQMNDMKKKNKNDKKKSDSNEEDESEDGVETANENSVKADIFGIPVWAKNLVSTTELKRIKNTGNDPSNVDPDDGDANGDNEPDESNTKVSKRPGFALASLINVEALLMASGELKDDSEADPNATLLADMLSQSVSKNISPESTKVEYSVQSEVVGDLSDIAPGPRSDLSISTELMLNQATQKIESFLNEATTSFSQENVQSIVLSATRSLSVDQNADVLKSTFDNIVATAENIARVQGLDVSEAAAQARATTKFTTEFLRVANGVLLSGYVTGGDMSEKKDESELLAKEMKISLDAARDAKPLFHRYESVQTIASEDFTKVSKQGAMNAKLAGAVYMDTIENIHELGHSMVANGTSADVNWMVTDSVGYNSDFESTSGAVASDPPTLVRTITIRGFDAADENVDREHLVTEICNAGKVPLSDEFPTLQVHRGLLEIAKVIYEDIKPYVELAGPMHNIVLNGHSIGGALANLVLMLMTAERGNIFVKEKISRVFTFGSPPIAKVEDSNESSDMYGCSILETLGLPADMVYGYAQPYDPIIRLFSPIDALYPLIGDLGEDGVTLYATGPPRTMRFVIKAILESWENWPRFRDNNKDVMQQDYMSIGVQHLLMPDSGRYLTDRLLSVNVNAYPVDEVLRVSSKDLYGALEEGFPLDVFTISLVPVAIRSFIHHFFPAYMDGLNYYVKKEEPNIQRSAGTKNEIPNNDVVS